MSKSEMPTPTNALPGRNIPMPVAETHFVNDHRIVPPFPETLEITYFALGCFWGAERKFWMQPGVYATAVGYAGGLTPHPTYEELCTGMTGHTEVVKVIFDPAIISYDHLLRCFWESHDPTQGMRQGNDRGTQYRSAIFTVTDQQQTQAINSRNQYQRQLKAAGLGKITTQIEAAPTFYYAEIHHQQYLAKNPDGYCGLGGTGVTCSENS